MSTLKTRLPNVILTALAPISWGTTYAVGGLILLPIALITEGSFTEITRTNLWGFIYLGLIGTGLAYALWFRGISKLNATAVSYLGLLSPLVATLIGYIFLQETFTTVQLLGIAIVLIAVVLGQQSQSSS